jgi:hypothetical protein
VVVVNNKWSNAVFQTFAKHNQATNSTVTTLKVVYFLETVMIFHHVFKYRFGILRVLRVKPAMTGYFCLLELSEKLHKSTNYFAINMRKRQKEPEKAEKQTLVTVFLSVFLYLRV